MNVQVISDPAGRLVWASPALPGARHDMGAAREHGIIDALTAAGVQVVADSGYRGAGPVFQLPQRRRPADRHTGERRRLSQAQREVNAAHAAQRGPGERTNAIDEILTRYQRAENEAGQAIGYGDGVAHFKTIIISDTEEEARHHAENVAWAWAESGSRQSRQVIL